MQTWMLVSIEFYASAHRDSSPSRSIPMTKDPSKGQTQTQTAFRHAEQSHKMLYILLLRYRGGRPMADH
jgi:hypothetical protein